jgi:hypothetical protein
MVKKLGEVGGISGVKQSKIVVLLADTACVSRVTSEDKSNQSLFNIVKVELIS